jgi:hypothetical protein
LWQNQTEGSNTELVAGTSFGFALAEGSNFYIGAYYRTHQDAVILSTGIDFKNLQLGLSYDINMSDLSVASNSKGGVEISLSYFGCIETVQRSRIIDCPRF